ncbi:Sodium/hydrogen exchanger protein [Aureococcus anophagefferens]|uniref:Sodium/hydrogen exchanger protein n=1 Tax=Aureococcus anophagefferens TaxID=44056 RepID=A0ABR1G8Y2_AURAN
MAPQKISRALLLAATLAICASAASSGNSTAHHDDHDDHDDDHGHHGQFDHFNSMFFMVVFVVVVWIVGKSCGAVGIPSLVGEIWVGIVLGPALLDFVPNPAVLKSVGEIGLALLVIEAGLHVDLEMLEIIGARGLAVGGLGSALPLCLGAGAATLWGAPPVKAFVVGACMATMSTGIALNVLKAGTVLNQPIGQLIIAAATPQRPKAVLACVFVAAMVLIPGCKYSGSSELLGAFLAGFCFCSDHAVHECWDRQVKRVMHWLLRLFFACTIGFERRFEIPVTECFKAGTLAKAGLLVCCIFGKLAMGCFAQPRDADHFWILAFAWGEWGEFSFLIATAARRVDGDGILDSGTYNAICLAVLVSMIICPAGLRSTLEAYERKAKFQIAEAIADTADVSGAVHATYFCLQTKSHATWEQSDHLLAATTRMGCDIIDSRQWHPNDHFGLAHCVNEMYIRDTSLELPTTLDMDEAQEARLQARIDEILDAVRAALREDEHQGAEIRVQRWLPGCHVEHDEASGRPRLATNADAMVKVEALAADANVYRGDDGKLRGAGFGGWHQAKVEQSQRRLSGLTRAASDASVKDVELADIKEGEAQKADEAPPPYSRFSSARQMSSFRDSSVRRLSRGTSIAQRLSETARRAFEPTRRESGLHSETLANAFHVEAHHELDGFVHLGAHHPFALPSALPDDDDHEKEDALLYGEDVYFNARRRTLTEAPPPVGRCSMVSEASEALLGGGDDAESHYLPRNASFHQHDAAWNSTTGLGGPDQT